MKRIGMTRIALFFSVIAIFLSLIVTGYADDSELMIVCGGDEETLIMCPIGDEENVLWSIACGNGICESFETCYTCIPDCGDCLGGGPTIPEDEDLPEENKSVDKKDLDYKEEAYPEDFKKIVILLVIMASLIFAVLLYNWFLNN